MRWPLAFNPIHTGRCITAALLCAVVLLQTGCATRQSPPADATAGVSASVSGHASVVPPPTPQPVVLTIWTMQLGTFGAVLNPVFQQFEAQHPGVKVRWVDVPFSEMEKRVLIAMLGKDVPDVINLNPAFSALLASRGALLDMVKAMPPAQQAGYLPVAWQSVSYQGKNSPAIAMGVPWYLTTPLTYWNTQLLPAGSAKRLPHSWPQLLALGPAVRAKNGAAQRNYITLPAIAEHGTFIKWLAKQGSSPCDPAATEWLQLLKTGIQRGDFPPDMITASHRQALEYFQQGRLVMLVAGSSVLKLLADNAPAQLSAITVSPHFGADAQRVEVATMLLAVPAQSKHPKLAVELAALLTGTQAQLALADAAPVLPSDVAALTVLSRQSVTVPKGPKAQVNGASANQHYQQLLTQSRQLGIAQLSRAKTVIPVWPNQSAIDAVSDYETQAALLGKHPVPHALQHICATLNAE
jgi:putative chitobiose transport system substrate-binding protein